MAEINLRRARQIISKTLAKGREMGLKPLSVVVLDAGGHVKAFEREDGASNLRFQVAHGKAYGAIGFGVGSRVIANRAVEQPHFVGALAGTFGDQLIPAPGGVLVKDKKGAILGAVGVTGDVSENDEIAAVAGIEAAGLVADPG
ncbi:MAG: heme-binding protein [Pseudomonadota bacterium]